MTVETANKLGRGRIQVSVSLWQQLGAPETTPETLDAWHKALLLPERYEIERIDLDLNRREFVLFVLSEAIPISDASISQMQVEPFYCLKDGTPYLDRIEISGWDGKRWMTKVDQIA